MMMVMMMMMMTMMMMMMMMVTMMMMKTVIYWNYSRSDKNICKAFNIDSSTDFEGSVEPY